MRLPASTPPEGHKSPAVSRIFLAERNGRLISFLRPYHQSHMLGIGPSGPLKSRAGAVSASLGVTSQREGCWQFLVWAPNAEKVEVSFVSPQMGTVTLERGVRGYHQAVANVNPGTQYLYRLDGEKLRPDPASRFQPRGVHGPSEIVAPCFAWGDGAWEGIPLQDYIIYEAHVGTFTPEGTLEAAIDYLDCLKSLGIKAVELMPVAQFPGVRNWGYDGAYPFAVQNSYGGPQDLKTFVDACHRRGLAVILDVVYNHLGPEGNYLADYGPYFTDRYQTPWGKAINFDGPQSDEVRRFFIENALYWVTEFHVDALRVDAVHAIFDRSACPFLEELGVAVHAQAEKLQRRIYVIPESDLNDPRIVLPQELGGMGLDAQWNDDFHHAVHTLLTHESSGYYQDFGALRHLAKAYREGYVYSGEYSAYRRRRHGRSSTRVGANKFVVFAQNHDQVGNRMLGDRLSQLVSFAGLKLAAGAVLLSPFIPLLFMGEEYGETAPFQYFVSHSDPALIAATRKGRQEEFAAFGWQGEVPDPQDEATFLRSKLKQELASQSIHRILKDFYKELIRLRHHHAPLNCLSKENFEVRSMETDNVLLLHRWSGQDRIFIAFNFARLCTSSSLPLPPGRWRTILDSEDVRWGGSGNGLPEETESAGQVLITLEPQSLAVFASIS
jgi:maltooligosyltrehalose trehalohydrolase